LIWFWAAGCGGDREVIDFRVVTAPGADPFAGAEELVVALEEEGRDSSLLELRYPIEAASGRLGDFPYGRGYRFRVDALFRGVLLSRGHSFPFAVTVGEPLRRPDVFVGRVGLFVAPIIGSSPGASFRVIHAIDEGALLATSDGTIFRYLAHSEMLDGSPELEEVGNAPYLSGAAWIGLGDGLLLAVGGVRGGAHLFDSSGAALSSLPRFALADQLEGQTLVALPGSSSALVIGGAPGPDDADLADVTRVDVIVTDAGTSTLIASSLPPMPRARRDATAVVTAVNIDADVLTYRVLLTGGTERGRDASSVLVIDPEGDQETREWDLGQSLVGAAIAPIFAGRVVVAGGRDQDGRPLSSVRVISLRTDAAGGLELDLVSPPPDPLFEARTYPVALPLGEGVVLIVGGRGEEDRPLASVELFDAREGLFPGRFDPTGPLPAPSGAPRAALLGDGSVLVAHEQGLAIYVPPFGP
jgi:hypothetical protein